MLLFAMAGELGFVVGDDFFFVVFQFQERDDVVAGAGSGQCVIVDRAKEQALGVYAFVFGHGLEKGKWAFGKLMAGSDDEYLFHDWVIWVLLVG